MQQPTMQLNTLIPIQITPWSCFFFDFLKKTLGMILRTARHRFERIKAMQWEYSIAGLCGTLSVTRSG
jgi:hypothetical protein